MVRWADCQAWKILYRSANVIKAEFQLTTKNYPVISSKPARIAIRPGSFFI